MSIKATPHHSLVVGEMPDPAPGAGEVRIAVTVSGLSAGDVKKRSGWQGSTMTYPRVIPTATEPARSTALAPESRRSESASTCGATGPSPIGHSAPLPNAS